jgi:hypothetical protein
MVYRAASSTGWTRATYRYLGNRLKGRHIAPASHAFYAERAAWLLGEIERTRGLQSISSVLDVGTGWSHYYSMVLSLFCDARFELFDVVDNRRIAEMQARARWLSEHLDSLVTSAGVTPSATAKDKLKAVMQAERIEEIYDTLGMHYSCEPDGSLNGYRSNSFDVVFSMDVLEHVSRKHFSETVGSYFRVLRKGGLTLHQIGIDDHLAHGVQHASQKQYLQFSPRTWALINSQLIYQNRLQFSEYKSLFARHGFELLGSDASSSMATLDGLTVDPSFTRLPAEDFPVTRASVVLAKNLSR